MHSLRPSNRQWNAQQHEGFQCGSLLLPAVLPWDFGSSRSTHGVRVLEAPVHSSFSHSTISILYCPPAPISHLMLHPASGDQFLIELDVSPPEWANVYGHGHHDAGHDDRLFELNRERDSKRAGRPALSKRLAFCWTGELSQFNPQVGGFP